MGLTSDECDVCRELDGDVESGNQPSILLESANISYKVIQATHAFRNTMIIPLGAIINHLDLLFLRSSLFTMPYCSRNKRRLASGDINNGPVVVGYDKVVFKHGFHRGDLSRRRKDDMSRLIRLADGDSRLAALHPRRSASSGALHRGTTRPRASVYSHEQQDGLRTFVDGTFTLKSASHVVRMSVESAQKSASDVGENGIDVPF